MNFRYKCAIQTIFGLLPNSEKLNYFAQKKITKNLPLSRGAYEIKLAQALAHHDVFLSYGNIEPINSVVYEIGCGWHLAMALIFSSLGYSEINALDVKNHVRAELINTNLKYLKEDQYISDYIDFIDNPDDIYSKLKSIFRINLLAPCDSTMTGLKENSIDFVYSQEVFEHIPPDLIPAIMMECNRIIKENGIISLRINYADHYYGIDETITPYNFLKYSAKKWKKYNPGLHYVNRMRHIDYMKILKHLNFEIIIEKTFRPDNWQEMLKDFIFNDEFSTKYTLEELSITSAHIVLKKIK